MNFGVLKTQIIDLGDHNGPFIIFRDFFPSHLQSTTVELLCPKLKSNDQLLNTINNFRSYFVKIHTSGSDSKESACSAGDLDLIPGSEDPLEKGMAVHSSSPFPFSLLLHNSGVCSLYTLTPLTTQLITVNHLVLVFLFPCLCIYTCIYLMQAG